MPEPLSNSGSHSNDATLKLRFLGRKTKLADQLVAELEALIVDGQLPPKTKLPPERDLAERFGVSRTVVREATRVLAAKGLLTSTPGVGTIIQEVTARHVTGPLNLLLQTQTEGVSFEELHQVRTLLEVEIAGLAAEHASEDDLQALGRLHETLQQAQGDSEAFAVQDAAFHSALAQATQNPLLAVLSDMLRHLVEDYLRRILPFLTLATDVLPFHERILHEVLGRDPAAARAAMQAHLEQVRRNHQYAARRAAENTENTSPSDG